MWEASLDGSAPRPSVAIFDLEMTGMSSSFPQHVDSQPLKVGAITRCWACHWPIHLPWLPVRALAVLLPPRRVQTPTLTG